MNRLIVLLAAVVALWAGAAGAVPEGECDVFLLIGQSNMAGRGELLPADTTEVIPGVWVLDSSGVPVEARAPLNRFSTIRKALRLQGYNPGMEFSREVHALTGRPVLLVVNARGGSSIMQWEPGAPDGYFDEAVARTRLAMRYGPLRGILWHQGETDIERATPGYAPRLGAMMRELRAQLGADSVPVVIGQVGRWGWEKPENIETHNDSVVPAAARAVGRCGYVTSEGLSRRYPDKERDPHFSREAQIELGRRYAARWRQLSGL